MISGVLAASSGQPAGGVPSWVGPASVTAATVLTAIVGYLTWRSNTIAKRGEIRLNDFKFGFDTMKETLDATVEDNHRLRAELAALRTSVTKEQRRCDEKINALARLIRRLAGGLPPHQRADVFKELENVIGS